MYRRSLIKTLEFSYFFQGHLTFSHLLHEQKNFSLFPVRAINIWTVELKLCSFYVLNCSQLIVVELFVFHNPPLVALKSFPFSTVRLIKGRHQFTGVSVPSSLSILEKLVFIPTLHMIYTLVQGYLSVVRGRKDRRLWTYLQVDSLDHLVYRRSQCRVRSTSKILDQNGDILVKVA